MDKPILTIRDAHDGCSWVETLEAPSRRKLTAMVKERNWNNNTGCGADCTGKVFAGSCKLLATYHADGMWVGVVYRSSARDV